MKSTCSTISLLPLFAVSLVFLLVAGCASSGQTSKVPPQPMTVSGTVVSQEDGAPLKAVRVAVKGASAEARTDEAGRYTLEVPDARATLVFAADSFLTHQIPVEGEYVVDAALKPAGRDEEEMVNVGYGKQRKRDVTGSVASVSAEDIQDRPVTRLEDLLVGRVAGVQLVQTPSGISVRIRGTNSIYGSSEPLYVVDGMPISVGPGGSLAINPHDIKSIEVLKDASSTAIYGSRGANGVILVTTKRGSDRK